MQKILKIWKYITLYYRNQTLSDLFSQIRMPIKRDKEGVIIEITLTDDEEEELDEEAAAKKKKEEEDAKAEVVQYKYKYKYKYK